VITWRFAARSLLRRPGRTLLGMGTLAGAFTSMLLFSSFFEGCRRQALDLGCGALGAHARLLPPSGDPAPGTGATLGFADREGLNAWLDRLIGRPEISGASARVRGTALLSTGPRSVGVRVVGIDPAREAIVSGITAADGPGAGGALLGADLAADLGIDRGDEIALLVPSEEGRLSDALVRFEGILRTGDPVMDGRTAVLFAPDLRRLMDLETGDAHEIALRLADPLAPFGSNQAAIAAADRREAALRTWRQDRPHLVQLLGLLDGSLALLLLLMALFSAAGVASTLFMNVYDRRRETGILRALGAPGSVPAAAVLWEGMLLGFLGLFSGLLLAAAIMAPLGRRGIDLSAFGTIEVAGITLADRLVPVWNAPWGIRSALLLLAVALLSSLLPAVRAARIPPARGMRQPWEGLA